MPNLSWDEICIAYSNLPTPTTRDQKDLLRMAYLYHERWVTFGRSEVYPR